MDVMKDAELIYVVKSWYDPNQGEPYIDWLENKHVREVLEEPGILWAKRVRLDQSDDNGWPCILLVYGFENRDALNTYMKSSSRLRFREELNEMRDIHYSERFWGDVDLKLAAK